MESKDYMLYSDFGNSPNFGPLGSVLYEAKDADVILFDDGLLTIVDSLVEDLRAQNNVTIKTGHPVTSLAYENSKILVWIPVMFKRVVTRANITIT